MTSFGKRTSSQANSLDWNQLGWFWPILGGSSSLVRSLWPLRRRLAGRISVFGFPEFTGYFRAMFLPKGIPFTHRSWPAPFMTYYRREEATPSIWNLASSSGHQTCPQSAKEELSTSPATWVFAGSKKNDESSLRAWGGWETKNIQVENMFRFPSGILWNVMKQSPDVSRWGQNWRANVQELCKGTLSYGQDESQSTAKRLISSSHMLSNQQQ